MAPRKTIKTTGRAARKRAKNDVDSEFESHDAKRRRLDGNAPLEWKPLEQRSLYHTQSNVPLSIGDDLADSEDEIDYYSLYQPIRERYLQDTLLDESEKKLINLWNTFIVRQRGFGIKHMLIICQSFIDSHIQNILQKNFYGHFLKHLCVLYDQCQLSSSQFMQLVKYIQENIDIHVCNNETNGHSTENGINNNIII